MLYLAELTKPIVGNPTLQLLARTQQQDSWQSVNEETIPIEGRAAREFKDGSLVLVDIGANRQINRITEAAKQVVTYLQNFSRLQERAREQEGEIEEWKQSLSFQSNELNRRLSELDSQEEEVRALYEKYQRAEEDTRVLEARQQELASLEAHLSEQQRLVGQQRENLRQQQEELAHHLGEAQKSRLGDEEAAELQSLLGHLATDLTTLSDPQQYLQEFHARLVQEQDMLDQALAQLEQEQQQAQQSQGELDQALQTWDQKRQDWLNARESLVQLYADVQTQTGQLALLQQHIQGITQALNTTEQAKQCADWLLQDNDSLTAQNTQSSGAPESTISLPDLETQVEQQRRLFEQRSGQVNQQVAELEQSQQQIAEKQASLDQASPDDRFDIEMDLDFLRESYKLLEETILPQQDSLQREYEELMRQEARLAQLRGDVTAAAQSQPKVDIGPLVALIQQQRSTQQSRKAALEEEKQKVAEILQTAQTQLDQQTQAVSQQQKQLFDQERVLRTRIQGMAERWGQLHQRRQDLEQAQLQLHQHQELMQGVAGSLQQMEGTIADGQTQLASMIGLLSILTDSPEGSNYQGVMAS